jgi:hypothetical protein
MENRVPLGRAFVNFWLMCEVLAENANEEIKLDRPAVAISCCNLRKVLHTLMKVLIDVRAKATGQLESVEKKNGSSLRVLARTDYAS